MSRFRSYDRGNDTITTTNRFGRDYSRKIKPYIRSGQDNDLPPEHREVLFQHLEGRDDIIADKGLNGGHCFSLPGDQPMLHYLWGLYIWTIILCPILFLIHFDWFGVDFTVASLVFPLSFAFLNPVSELYGQRSARRLLNNTVVRLLAIAGLSWLILKLATVFDHSGYSHGYEIESVVISLAKLPTYYAALAGALWITDSINIWFFQTISRWMNQQWFWVRSLLSNSLSQIVFTPMCAFFLSGAFWLEDDTLNRVAGITGIKLLLVFIYLPIAVTIVRRAQQWRRDNIK